MRRRRFFFSGCAVLSFVLSAGVLQGQAAQPAVDRNAVFAREEFRRGVQAYNRYAFNEAILSFEKALSFRPQESLILNWLGRAYYRSGLEDTAVRQWQSALSLLDRTANEALLLNGRIETVRNRRSLFPELDENARYVEAGRYPGRNGEIVVYRQPSSLLPLEDGSVWVVAYGSNELVLIDVNGIVRRRVRGPLNGFDRPYDIARGPDGRLFVSEYRGGRISVLDARGEWRSYIGSKGQGEGQLVGPQNIASDEDGYLYVVDYGTRRVSKFDPDGAFLFSFGGRSGAFPGFRAPTGIAARDGEVYVADNLAKTVYRFDRSGNYLGVFADSGLSGPEALRFTADGRLLLADTRRILLLDPSSGVIRELGSLGNASVRVTCADVDGNGNILASNFQAGEVSVMARMDDIAAGLFVQIERVVSDKFPEITVELRVEDRRRRPIVGLEGRNFLLTEEGAAVEAQAFQGAAYLTRRSDISILMERSPAMLPYLDDAAAAVRDAAAASDRLVSLVSAGEQPVKERIDTSASTAAAARGAPASYTPRWRFDLGLRLAAGDLLAGEKKRAVVYVGTGKLGERAFERYGLSELAAYLANNGVRFYVVSLGEGAVDRELAYLCGQTGGAVLPLYRSQGIGAELRRLRDAPEGTYQLSYRSRLPTDFGRAYLPVEAEVYLLDRSGRDALGYFPPLE